MSTPVFTATSQHQRLVAHLMMGCDPRSPIYTPIYRSIIGEIAGVQSLDGIRLGVTGRASDLINMFGAIEARLKSNGDLMPIMLADDWVIIDDENVIHNALQIRDICLDAYLGDRLAMVTTTEASKYTTVTANRLSHICAQGLCPFAEKKAKTWFAPEVIIGRWF